MSDIDIRWQQRLSNFSKALAQLESAVNLSSQRPLSQLEKQGLIQAFEFTHELAWNLLKDYFAYQGTSNITGSRDASREAFNKQLITDGEGWMEMVKSCNQSSHTYNQATADEIAQKVTERYYPLFRQLEEKMEQLKSTS